jgi:hypothetical protein
MTLVAITQGVPAVMLTESLSPGETEFEVLRAFLVDRCMLTARQLQVRTGRPLDEVTRAIVGLCSSGRLRRLNTLVESYCLPSMTPRQQSSAGVANAVA